MSKLKLVMLVDIPTNIISITTVKFLGERIIYKGIRLQLTLVYL